MPGRTDSRVDAYLAELPDWQRELCQLVRETVHAADPDVQETIKRTVRPYFVLDGNICALQATRDHVNVFIYDPTVSDPEKLINQGHDNATAKAIQLYQDQPVNRDALKAMFVEVIAHNRAGGWRKLG